MTSFRSSLVVTFLAFLSGLVLGETDSETLVNLDELHSKCEGIDIRELSIEQAHAHFESGKLTSKQLTECYLKRIEALNPILKAVIEVNPDAVSIAEGIDNDVKATGKRKGPLCGMPILLKDIFGTNDKTETTAGALALVGVRPLKDADIVTNLRAAGAVILGKANMAEFSNARGMNIPNGWSSRGGLTKNPYNLLINPSGSSSGSAVATASNLCMAALGAETGSALISPSNSAACVGLKPTLGSGIISMKGTIPVSDLRDIAGPIARTVLDVAAVLDGMMSSSYPKPNLEKCGATFISCLKTKRASSKKFKIGVPRNPFWKAEYTNIKLLVEEAPVLDRMLEKMVEADLIEKEDVTYEASKISMSTLLNVTAVVQGAVLLPEFKVSLERYLKEDVKSDKIRTIQDIVDFYKENPSPEGYDAAILGFTQDTTGLDDQTYKESLPFFSDVAKKYLESVFELQKLDAIAVPAEPRIDTQEYAALGKATFNAVALASISGYPSITVPVDVDKVGAPFGICFIGKPNSELRLLRIAKAAEEAWPGRKAPKFLDKID